MLTIGLLTLSMVFAQGPIGDWVPKEFLDENVYKIEYTLPKRGVGVKRLADEVGISIMFRSSSPKIATMRIQTARKFPDDHMKPASGFPLGRQCHVVSEPGRYLISYVNNYERGYLSVNGKLIREDNNRFPEKLDFSKDALWFESLLRRSISGYAHKRIKGESSQTVSGKAVGSFTADGSKEVYVNLVQWASARGASATRNDEAHRISLDHNGTTYLFSLGSESVKVGSEWKLMNDILIEYKGSYWAPLSTLPK